MWLMLQQKEPDDYVIATGEAHSVREFVEKAFELVGLDWQKYVKVDKRFFRPLDVLMPRRRLLKGQAQAWLGTENKV